MDNTHKLLVKKMKNLHKRNPSLEVDDGSFLTTKKARLSPEDGYPIGIKMSRSNPQNDVQPPKVKRRRASTGNDEHRLGKKDEHRSGLSPQDTEDDKKLSLQRVTYGFHLVKGKMGHGMEDYTVAETRQVNHKQLGLYAIFDGHSGKEVAEYLQKHLFDNILSESDFWTNPKHAIKRAYKVTDDVILEGVVGSRGGSTAVTAILINGEKLIVGNVGDSRAIICRKDSVQQITVDHEPQKEKRLVERRGGFVSTMPGGIPRVDGQLAMTRAFGDEKLKEHITSEPDVAVLMIDTDVEFIILASDGLWKVMSNQEAAACIKELRDAQEASEELIKEALSRESHDDISCIVVAFN